MTTKTVEPSYGTGLPEVVVSKLNEGIVWRIEYDDSIGIHHVIDNVPQFPAAPPMVERLPLWYPPRPTVSRLYQNFPNPFNPDTWIPYQLTEDMKVKIQIFSLSGEVVRELNLGYRPAGVYLSQNRAAYWDGKNEAGEEVASGTYFYTIQAGEYTATKKMVVAR